MQPDLNKIMRDAQKAMQQMQQMQDELGRTNVEGTAGGGAVVVTCNGMCEFSKVKIKAEAVDPNDVETLEDLVLAALKDATGKAQAMMQQRTSAMGMNLPPGLGF